MSPEPFYSRAKALPAKRSEKGYGDENVVRLVSPIAQTSLVSLPDLIVKSLLVNEDSQGDVTT